VISERAPEVSAVTLGPPPQIGGDRVRDIAAVAIPAVLAVALSCYQIGSRSLGFDEAATVTIAAQHGSALWSAIGHDGGNMSGYYFLLHFLIAWFGNGAVLVRLPSAVLTGVGVAAVGALAIRLFDRKHALVSGLLAAVSLPLAFWGQSARGYAPMVALVSCSFLAFAVLVDRRLAGRPIRWAWLAYAITTALAVYMSFVALLVIPAQLTSLLFARRALRPALSALVVSATCCIPLLVLGLERGSGQLFWVPRPSLSAALSVLETVTSAALTPSFHRTATTIPLVCLSVVLIAAVAIAIAHRPPRHRDQRARWSLSLLLGWLFVPIVLAALESFVGPSIFLPRNMLMCLPAVALILGLGICDIRLPGVVALSAFAALIALRALALAPSYGVSPEDWRAATAHVMAQSRPGDCIAFYPADGRMAFEYYRGTGNGAPRSVLPAVAWDQIKPYVEDYSTLTGGQLRRVASECNRLWLVSSHQGQANGPSGSRTNYAGYLMLRDALAKEFRAPQRAVSFGYAAPVRAQLFVH
jgi:mannosyltransferase